MSSSDVENIPVERVFRESWLDPSLRIESLQQEVIAYLHWTRPNHFGGRQNFQSAIGLLRFELPSGSYYLLGIIGKSSKRARWEPSFVECGDPEAPPRWNHSFYLVRPNTTELATFADAWDFNGRLAGEIVVEQFSIIHNPGG